MEITERQRKILNTIIEEHINSAEPVGSKLLEEKYDFEVCPATIRNEMQKLTDKGYLRQPHTSAGRVPTDKGYRLFVDELLKEDGRDFDRGFVSQIKEMEKEMDDSLRFAQALTKRISEITSSLALSYLSGEDLVLKEGWGRIIKEPEFEDQNYFSKFVDMVEQWEDGIDDFNFTSKVQVFIGKENPFPKVQDFSIVVSRYQLPKKEKGVLAIIGPKRMDYDKNINLINSLTHLMENL